MSGIWDRSFDEYDENDEDGVAEGEEEKMASHVKKQFGYFGALILQISLGCFIAGRYFWCP